MSDEIAFATKEYRVGPWHRDQRSYADGEPPHRGPGDTRIMLVTIWADSPGTVPVVEIDHDGCWALVIQPDSLDDAWDEAEAALPEGWRIDSVALGVMEASWWARAWPARGGTGVVEHGDTPRAALRALAAKLREVGR